jgi:hypothetical protein
VAGEDSNSVPTTDTEAENKRQKGLISKTTDSQAQRDQNTSIKRKELQQQELEESRKCRDKKEDKIVEREKTPNAKLTVTEESRLQSILAISVVSTKNASLRS